MTGASRRGTRAEPPRGGPAVLESEAVEYVGYHDLDGNPGFKMAVQNAGGRWLLYLGHLWRSGWSVLDVTDPTAPELVRTWAGPANTWTIQVQAADGLLVTGLEKPADGWGFTSGSDFAEGVQLWDIKSDPTEPALLGSWRTGGTGTHRNFYAGGRYAYLAAAKPGYLGNVLRVLDVSNPSSPHEVSFWAAPEQHDSDAGPGVPQAYLHGPAYVVGDRAYLSYGRLGLVVLDVRDPATPALVSRLDFGDLGGKIGCHSAVPVPGRDLLVVNSEAIEEGSGDQLNYTFVVDIADDANPKVISSFPLPVPDRTLAYRNYYEKGGRFGPHNQHHDQGNPAHLTMRDRVVMTYFNAGLRVFDIADPLQPVEVGHFVPENPARRTGVLPSVLVTQFEDVLVDARGYIYCTDKNFGLFILRFPGGLT